MKYLKSIFESNEMDDMKKYIYECFVDFLDENAETIFDEDQDVYAVVIKIKSFREQNRREAGWDNRNISNFITTIDRLKEASTLIEECIEKVEIKYPNIEYSISLDNKSNSIHNLFINVNFYLGQENINNLELGDADSGWDNDDFFRED